MTAERVTLYRSTDPAMRDGWFFADVKAEEGELESMEFVPAPMLTQAEEALAAVGKVAASPLGVGETALSVKKRVRSIVEPVLAVLGGGSE